jgi:hypothetical protein
VFSRALFFTVVACLLSSCADRAHVLRVSVADQKMQVFRRGNLIAAYDVSTSKFGLSDRPGSNGTPLGRLEVAKKIGARAPLGMKFKSRKPTGEIVPVNAPGRDPIVTRILWLKGLEAQNRHTFERTIYIHGTPEESKIGHTSELRVHRMRSHDVVKLFETIGVGGPGRVTPHSFGPADGICRCSSRHGHLVLSREQVIGNLAERCGFASERRECLVAAA